MLCVFTTAAPTDGQANKSVVENVAKALRVPKTSITIKRGAKSRDKTLAIASLSRAELQVRLDAL